MNTASILDLIISVSKTFIFLVSNPFVEDEERNYVVIKLYPTNEKVSLELPTNKYFLLSAYHSVDKNGRNFLKPKKLITIISLP